MAYRIKNLKALRQKAPDLTVERILTQSLPLFAQRGFDGVSVREVAAQFEVTPAALYYHFKDKEELYLELVSHAFGRGVKEAIGALDQSGSPWDRLETFVRHFTQLVAGDRDLQRLMQWVLLDTDENRSRHLAEGVFQPFYLVVSGLLGQIADIDDPYPLVLSIFGLMVFPFECAHVARFMSGFSSPHEHHAVLADQVMQLLRYGLISPEKREVPS